MMATAEFSLLEFPDIPRITSIVYEIGILGPARGFRPFYVGKVERAHRTLGNRLGEYLVASCATTTDFYVGNVVAKLQERNIQVYVRHSPSVRPGAEELQRIHAYASQRVSLLNRFPQYSLLKNCPRVALRSQDGRTRAHIYIRRFIDALVANLKL